MTIKVKLQVNQSAHFQLSPIQKYQESSINICSRQSRNLVIVYYIVTDLHTTIISKTILVFCLKSVIDNWHLVNCA